MLRTRRQWDAKVERWIAVPSATYNGGADFRTSQGPAVLVRMAWFFYNI